MDVKSPQNLTELTNVFRFVEKELNIKPDHVRNLGYYKKQFKVTPQFLIYIEKNREILGALLAIPQKNDNLLVGELAVSKKTQGKGIGSMLLNEIEKRAKKYDKNNILLGSLETAEKFYIKHNYKPMLFIQLKGPNKLNELKSFAIENSQENRITWESTDSEFSKIVIDTPNVDKILQYKANRLSGVHTQYLFSKKL